MANLASKKQAFSSKIVEISERLVDVILDAKELEGFYFSNGFNSGGVNMLIDLDFDNTNNAHLTAAIVGSVITTLQALDTAMTQGHRDNLRKGSSTPST